VSAKPKDPAPYRARVVPSARFPWTLPSSIRRSPVRKRRVADAIRTYDSRNRALTKTDALLKTESFAWDAAGNLKFVTDRKGQVTGYQYDFLNRLTQHVDTAPGAGTLTRS